MSSDPSSSAGPSVATASQTSPSKGNSFFQKWQREFSLLTGYGIDPNERVYEIHHRRCEEWKKDLMHHSPAVVFMLKHLRRVGADVRPEHFPCIPCHKMTAGGFDHDSGAVVLCQGTFGSKKYMEQTMVHEMIHMYDHAKFNVNWYDLRHHACSEIRANNLSGDCTWLREFFRGGLAFSKQHQTCVRRRAAVSVSGNPACPDVASAERAVNEVWESCFNDTRPFDEIY